MKLKAKFNCVQKEILAKIIAKTKMSLSKITFRQINNTIFNATIFKVKVF